MRRRGKIFPPGGGSRALDWVLLSLGILLLGLVAVYGTVLGRDARIAETMSTASDPPQLVPAPVETPPSEAGAASTPTADNPEVKEVR